MNEARLRDTLRHTLIQHRQALEEQTFSTLADDCLVHFLYGPRGSDALELRSLAQRLQIDSYYASLLQAMPPSQVWTQLLREFFTEPSVALHTVRALPSAQAAEAVAAEAKQVVESRLATLGVEALEALETRMEQAVEANETPVPRELIENIPVPSVDAIFVRSQASCVVFRGEIGDLWDGGDAALRAALEWEAKEVAQR